MERACVSRKPTESETVGDESKDEIKQRWCADGARNGERKIPQNGGVEVTCSQPGTTYKGPLHVILKSNYG